MILGGLPALARWHTRQLGIVLHERRSVAEWCGACIEATRPPPRVAGRSRPCFARFMSRAFDVASSAVVLALRMGAGYTARPASRQPDKLLQLYEFEACPFCRHVREALSEFDLDALVFPCPKGGTRFRPRVVEMGGKARFPFLVDPNSGRAMFESAEIVSYLRDTYGAPEPSRCGGPLAVGSGALAAAVRVGHGNFARSSREPAQPLELWSFEASIYSRLVREALCELELPYLLHNVAKGSPRRETFVARSGKMMVPYLVDPNTGRALFESADIVRYLNETYGAAMYGLRARSRPLKSPAHRQSARPDID